MRNFQKVTAVFLLLLCIVPAFPQVWVKLVDGTGTEKGTAANPLTTTGGGGGGNTTVIGPDAAGVAPTQNPVQGSGFDGTNVQRMRTDTSGRTVVVGGGANGAATAGNPVLIAASDAGGGTVRTIHSDTSGNLVVSASVVTAADGINTSNMASLQAGANSPLESAPHLYNGNNAWDRARSASLASFPTSVTTTARNTIGALLSEKTSRWSVVSNPAAGSQATASIAAEASVRHVVDCVSFAAAAITAPTSTLLTVNVRDGATGAGNLIWTWQVEIPATANAQEVAPHSVCGLNLVGTTNTAMTAEFSASLTNLTESVSISGYNVN